MKKWVGVILVATLVFGFAAVGFAAKKAIPVNQMRIFFIVKASESAYWQIVLDGGKKAAKHFGIKKFIHQEATAESDVAKQVAILETAISMKPDAIVIAPTVADALVPGIEKAMKSGIPVIIIDSAANTKNYVSFLASDNYKIGVTSADMMAKALKKKFGAAKGKVAAITFMSGVGSLEKRKKGFLDEIKKYPGIKVVAMRDAQGKQGNTISIVQNLLTAYPDLKGIYANNQYTGDEMVRALAMAKKKDLATVAVDSGPQELWGIKNGYLDAMLVQRPWVMGYAGVAYAIMAREGVPLAKYVDTGIVAVTPQMVKSGEADAVLKPIEFHKNW